MAGWVLRWLSAVRTRLRQRLDLLLEFIVLRHQLAVLQRTGARRPCFRPTERLFWLFLSRSWANWQRSLIIVQPATVLRWRRRGLWAIWLSDSCRRWRGGRPRISSEVRALIVRMSQENFLWGASRGELLKLGFDVSQGTVSRYMPRRGYPPTQTWRTFLRNQAFGIGTIGLGEAGRLSDALLALVRGWIARVVRCVTKVRDGFRCGLIEPSLTLHRLRPYRFSNRTARRDPGRGCMPVPRPPTTLGRGDKWIMAARRLSPYRSRASPTRKLPAFTNFARPTATARASGPQFRQRDCTIVCTARLPRTTQKSNHPQCPSPAPRPFCESALADEVMRNHNGACRSRNRKLEKRERRTKISNRLSNRSKMNRQDMG
jgi:hypothetical protein